MHNLYTDTIYHSKSRLEREANQFAIEPLSYTNDIQLTISEEEITKILNSNYVNPRQAHDLLCKVLDASCEYLD